MGIAEFLHSNHLLISSHIIIYGNAADEIITERIRNEIENMWNEPRGTIRYENGLCLVQFKITAQLKPEMNPEEILGNDNPLTTYFRVEETARGNISFVDGLGCNTGYFQLDNLYEGSTTAAHEYGHTLGLAHPFFLDIRGKGRPGIMYPRGTLVDAAFQYNPAAAIGEPGSTMHPMHRRVLQTDIDQLKIHQLEFNNNVAVFGNFSSVWHPNYGNG
jgi:hypothetical protein